MIGIPRTRGVSTNGVALWPCEISCVSQTDTDNNTAFCIKWESNNKHSLSFQIDSRYNFDWDYPKDDTLKIKSKK